MSKVFLWLDNQLVRFDRVLMSSSQWRERLLIIALNVTSRTFQSTVWTAEKLVKTAQLLVSSQLPRANASSKGYYIGRSKSVSPSHSTRSTACHAKSSPQTRRIRQCLSWWAIWGERKTDHSHGWECWCSMSSLLLNIRPVSSYLLVLPLLSSGLQIRNYKFEIRKSRIILALSSRGNTVTRCPKQQQFFYSVCVCVCENHCEGYPIWITFPYLDENILLKIQPTE